MPVKIAFVNGKGGCGKTTSLFHIAGVLSKAGDRVLVLDFDKQRNTTDTLLMHTAPPEKTIYDCLCGAPIGDAAQKAHFQSRGNATPKYYGIDCIASDIRLEDENLLGLIKINKFLENLEEYLEINKYQWVLLDMPPSSKTLNDLCFSFIVDYILVPFSSDIYSVSGYGDILNAVEDARRNNPELKIIGVFLARYMANCAVDKYIKEQLEQFDTFIDVQIPVAADVREGIFFGRPISYYKTVSNSRKAYEDLVGEIIKRVNLSNK